MKILKTYIENKINNYYNEYNKISKSSLFISSAFLSSIAAVALYFTIPKENLIISIFFLVTYIYLSISILNVLNLNHYKKN